MAVYFVYRCHYNAPGERHVRRFAFDTVVDWVRSIWKPIPDNDKAYQYAEDLLGGLDVYMFGRMFLAIAEEGLPPPENMEQVMDAFRHLYVQGEDHGPHHLQILTDDDEEEMALYLFDDHFRAPSPGLTDFLLLDGWELPGTWSGEGSARLPDTRPLAHRGDGEGTLYAFSLFAEDSLNLTDLCGGSRVEGARVSDLCRYVLTHPDEDALEYGLRSIRDTLQELLAAPGGEDAGFRGAIRDSPGERVHWAVYSDWLEERGRPPAGLYLLEAALGAEKFAGARKNRDPSLDRVKVTPHMAQACKHEGRWPEATFLWFTPSDSYTQWVYFDDCWVAANPTLAAGIARFAARWDVLSTGPREGADG
jgi:uncharacterized protein (TIGR02996 family)